jgi:UDP-N-acetylmuramoylalanine-D-glutamate ligase
MKESKKSYNFLETSSMKEAVDFAFANTEKWKICLLSCASPSYSLWKNFESKWDEFRKYIEEQ